MNKIVKMSYHVVYQHLVFAGNCDTLMKRLATVDDTPENAAFFYVNTKGVRECVVDTSVYTRNRLFRILGCTKRGVAAPLLPLPLPGLQQFTHSHTTAPSLVPPLRHLSVTFCDTMTCRHCGVER